jgi:hypothetical protein
MISYAVIVDTSFDMLVLLKNLSKFFVTNTTVMGPHHLTLCLLTKLNCSECHLQYVHCVLMEKIYFVNQR